MCAMNCKDGQLELCLALLTGSKTFQYLIASPCSDRAHKIELVIDIVCNLNSQTDRDVYITHARPLLRAGLI